MIEDNYEYHLLLQLLIDKVSLCQSPWQGYTITGGVLLWHPGAFWTSRVSVFPFTAGQVRFTRLKGLMESSKMYRKMAPPDGKASDFCGAGADEVQTAWKRAFGRSEVICDWDGKYSVIVYRNLHPTNLHFGIFRPSILGFENMGHLSSTCFHVSIHAHFLIINICTSIWCLCAVPNTESIYCLVGDTGFTNNRKLQRSTAASTWPRLALGQVVIVPQKKHGLFQGPLGWYSQFFT